jgi:hypothetical protein
LETAEKFLVLPFAEQEIVVRKLCILLLRLAFDFLPGAFEFEFCRGYVIQ